MTCCNEKELVQDKLCCDFRLTDDTATTIFTADPFAMCAGFFASGMIKNCGSVDFVATFVRGVTAAGTGGVTVRTLTIPAGGCATFTVSNFDAINITAVTATVDTPAVGEFCITPRYRVG
ncbi:hypothetical protein BKP35_16250 [Anaerobacillus arseniciselenatis]|uniref:Endospore appendages core domain-containing protein n=1 Tax=Anaerobacillus arseniciselenatis TaxID=85682 RepID=A0A1S2LCE5_9BACI|nr:S-Ena type endospore appendage [Anaerobacillus arseniciselenatis]OIJ09407.1 hypothetical protein BKP35_16250 [Anaerobacillus arseniciselenatis]